MVRKSPQPLAGIEVSSGAASLLVSGVAHAERLAVGDHQRNAKLQLTVLLALPEAVPDLYLHPEHRRRRSRPPLRTEFNV